MIAIPLVLTMGWSESPPAFCATTETVADLANTILGRDMLSLWVLHCLDTVLETVAIAKTAKKAIPVESKKSRHSPSSSLRPELVIPMHDLKLQVGLDLKLQVRPVHDQGAELVFMTMDQF